MIIIIKKKNPHNNVPTCSRDIRKRLSPHLRFRPSIFTVFLNGILETKIQIQPHSKTILKILTPIPLTIFLHLPHHSYL